MPHSPGVPHTAGAARATRDAGAARMHATSALALAGALQPSAAGTPAFCSAAAAAVREMLGEPESAMAAAKRPREAGELSSAKMAVPPLLWPHSVTRVGSPPKAATLSRTQPSASCRSWMP